jgi:acetyl-CoA C-acetyltransferase
MREAVICSPLRTPVGRYGGNLKKVPPAELAAIVIRALVERYPDLATNVDDVILGQCYPNGEAPAIGRVAALDAGLPVSTTGIQIDRRCGSGLQAVCYAAMLVQTGVAEVVIAGGAESMSQADFYSTRIRFERGEELGFHDRLARSRVTAGGRFHPVPGGMLETAENLRRQYRITRLEQDELALESHRRAWAAIDRGSFDAEIVPVPVPEPKTPDAVVRIDGHPRRDVTAEALAALRPVLGRADADATVTAGNASGQNDGAAVCLVTHPERAEALGLSPMGRLVSWSVAGVGPEVMGIGPVPASAAALERAGLSLADMDLIELNEAFAAQVLAVTREWKFAPADFARMNVNGSGIALGHPVGATGVRILATLLHEMRRRGARYGLETMCIGGGQGMSAVFELIP